MLRVKLRERGLEPPLGFPNQALNLARLPIPPFPPRIATLILPNIFTASSLAASTHRDGQQTESCPDVPPFIPMAYIV